MKDSNFRYSCNATFETMCTLWTIFAQTKCYKISFILTYQNYGASMKKKEFSWNDSNFRYGSTMCRQSSRKIEMGIVRISIPNLATKALPNLATKALPHQASLPELATEPTKQGLGGYPLVLPLSTCYILLGFFFTKEKFPRTGVRYSLFSWKILANKSTPKSYYTSKRLPFLNCVCRVDIEPKTERMFPGTTYMSIGPLLTSNKSITMSPTTQQLGFSVCD